MCANALNPDVFFSWIIGVSAHLLQAEGEPAEKGWERVEGTTRSDGPGERRRNETAKRKKGCLVTRVMGGEAGSLFSSAEIL